MKKILALLLVLLMAASVVLVSCDNKKPPVDDDDDDEYNNIQSTESESDSESESESESGSVTPPADEWVNKDDTVYAGVNGLNLRTSAQQSANNVAKQVNAGAKMTRISTNGIWSKVTLEGETTEYYVVDSWLSTNGGNFSYTACTPVDLTINDTEYNIIFFQSPFENEDPDQYFTNAVGAGGFKLANVEEGYKLQKVGTSANNAWIKVTFVGKITFNQNNVQEFTEANPGTLYVKMRAIERGDITDPTYNPGGSQGGIG